MIATLDEHSQRRTIAVMLRRTKAGDIRASRAGRCVLYPLGLVTAAIAMREGLVMASSRSSSLRLASEGKIFGDRRERPVRLEIREAGRSEIAAPVFHESISGIT